MRAARIVAAICLLVLTVCGSVAVATAAPGGKPGKPPKPTPTPTPTPTTDACGTVLAKPDGSAWQCSFVDDFDGTALDRTRWVPQTNLATGTDGARSCHVDDPANVAVANGTLRLTVRPVSAPVTCQGQSADYTSGQVSTYYKFSQQYGRFEARMKVPSADVPGLQEAFWLWPDVRYPQNSLWPAAGEIDIVETYSQHPDLAIPFLHYTYNDNGGPVPGLNTAWNCAASRGVFNTYTLLWQADRLEILVNGRTCLVNTSGDPAFQKPYIVALTQALGVGANQHTGAAPMPATTEVDYVKVWR